MDDPGADFIGQLADHELEALVETMYLVAFSDGSYSAPERARFAHCVSELTDGRMAGAQFEHVVARIVRRLRDEGMDACVRALRDRLRAPRLRSVALILASDMAAADGVLHPAERQVLLSLADAFQVPPEDAREVLDGFASG